MGLLDLLLQNQSALDTSPTPQQGNGPVGTPTGEFNTGTTQFQQVWNSNNTYLSAFEGGVNVGIQPPTLAETGLDIDNPNFIPSTTTPNTLTAYPATALGGLGQSAVQFLQIWTPVINYNNVVVGAPTSPLEQSLDETGLDIENQNAALTTVSPINTTNYPIFAQGEFNGAPTQYIQTWTPTNQYIVNYNPNIQPNTLTQTGLDVENQNAAPTTETPNTITQYPSLAKGEFGGSSGQFSQNYTPNNTYLNSNTINAQQGTLDLTGLDNVDSNSLPITFTPNNISAPTDYGIISPSPQIQMGEFGGAPSQYQTIYTPNNTYLSQFNNIVNPTTNPQINTLDETGLDIENQNSIPTTSTPDTITVYPLNVTGELGEAPSQFNQEWVPTNEYYNFMKTNYQAR